MHDLRSTIMMRHVTSFNSKCPAQPSLSKTFKPSFSPMISVSVIGRELRAVTIQPPCEKIGSFCTAIRYSWRHEMVSTRCRSRSYRSLRHNAEKRISFHTLFADRNGFPERTLIATNQGERRWPMTARSL